MTWKELFGTGTMPADQRRANWTAFLATADQEVREYWDDAEGCEDCIHHERGEFNWCRRQQLPCSTNPYLTFRHGMIGMACMGAGKEVEQQVRMEI